MRSGKILVTGATGFVGRNLCDFLESEGYEIYQIGSSFDLRKPDALDPLLNENFNWVVHCAGKVFVPDSWNDPAGFYDVNVTGTLRVLEYCRRKKIGMTLLSAYIYGIPEQLPIGEDHLIQPSNPYAWSKHLSEKTAEMYHHSFSLPVQIVRPFNIYGSKQPSHFVIPTIFDQIRSGKVEVMDLEPRRDYIHIHDLCRLIALTIGREGMEVFNGASGVSFSVGEIIGLASEILDVQPEISNAAQKRPNEIPDTRADISHAKRVLNWEPEISIRQGLAELLSEKN